MFLLVVLWLGVCPTHVEFSRCFGHLFRVELDALIHWQATWIRGHALDMAPSDDEDNNLCHDQMKVSIRVPLADLLSETQEHRGDVHPQDNKIGEASDDGAKD